MPPGVIWPMRLPPNSVNQRFPSGPLVMPSGALPAVGSVNSVITPAGVIRPMRSPPRSVNQRFPSGPLVMPDGARALWKPGREKEANSGSAAGSTAVNRAGTGRSPQGPHPNATRSPPTSSNVAFWMLRMAHWLVVASNTAMSTLPSPS